MLPLSRRAVLRQQLPPSRRAVLSWPGASSVEQVRDNLKALEVRELLTPELLARIDAAVGGCIRIMRITSRDLSRGHMAAEMCAGLLFSCTQGPGPTWGSIWTALCTARSGAHGCETSPTASRNNDDHSRVPCTAMPSTTGAGRRHLCFQRHMCSNDRSSHLSVRCPQSPPPHQRTKAAVLFQCLRRQHASSSLLRRHWK